MILDAHGRICECFAPKTATGVTDASGFRELFVGTGSRRLYGYSPIQPNTQVKSSDTFVVGLLRLLLHV